MLPAVKLLTYNVIDDLLTYLYSLSPTSTYTVPVISLGRLTLIVAISPTLISLTVILICGVCLYTEKVV